MPLLEGILQLKSAGLVGPSLLNKLIAEQTLQDRPLSVVLFSTPAPPVFFPLGPLLLLRIARRHHMTLHGLSSCHAVRRELPSSFHIV